MSAFWKSYGDSERCAPLVCGELLYEQTEPASGVYPFPDLRRAVTSDLDIILPAHAEMVRDETKVDPLKTDLVGFRQRCANRILQGRTWALIEDKKLIFKADVVADTDRVIYLEGIYVDPESRRRGYGLRCQTQISRTFLNGTNSICCFVNEKNTGAQRFYEKAGFTLRSRYDKIFPTSTLN